MSVKTGRSRPVKQIGSTVPASPFECEWDDCCFKGLDLSEFLEHVHNHRYDGFLKYQYKENCHMEDDGEVNSRARCLESANEDEREWKEVVVYRCKWRQCNQPTFEDEVPFEVHVNYHGYHAKLIAWGISLLKKEFSKDPQFASTAKCLDAANERMAIPELMDGFTCYWDGCQHAEKVFLSPERFYRHVDDHVMSEIEIPSMSREQLKKTRFATCKWEECDFSCNSRTHLKEHMRTHTQERLVACPTCGTMFVNNTKFLNHFDRAFAKGEAYGTTILEIQSVATNETHREGASTSFSEQGDIITLAHVAAAVADGKQPSCSESKFMIPGKGSSSSSVGQTLIAKAIVPTPKFTCAECAVGFNRRSVLVEHMRKHKKNLKCPRCGFGASNQSILDNHMLYRHSDQRKFSCQFCSSSFKRASDLRRHIATHSADNPFPCLYCDFSARCCHTLARHVRTVHAYKGDEADMDLEDDTANEGGDSNRFKKPKDVGDIFQCHECERKFTRGNNLSRHLITVHKLRLPKSHSRFTFEKLPSDPAHYQVSLSLRRLLTRGPLETADSGSSDGFDPPRKAAKSRAKYRLNAL